MYLMHVFNATPAQLQESSMQYISHAMISCTYRMLHVAKNVKWLQFISFCSVETCLLPLSLTLQKHTVCHNSELKLGKKNREIHITLLTKRLKALNKLIFTMHCQCFCKNVSLTSSPGGGVSRSFLFSDFPTKEHSTSPVGEKSSSERLFLSFLKLWRCHVPEVKSFMYLILSDSAVTKLSGAAAWLHVDLFPTWPSLLPWWTLIRSYCHPSPSELRDRCHLTYPPPAPAHCDAALRAEAQNLKGLIL